MIRGFIKKYNRLTYLLEAVMWLIGLALLACMEPEGEHLFSLCPYSWFLQDGCIGCGIGHGIAFLLKGNIQASWQAHPLAAPALGLILWRFYSLINWHRQHFYNLTLTNQNG